MKTNSGVILLAAIMVGCVQVEVFPFEAGPRPAIGAAEVRFVDQRPEGCEALARLSVQTDSPRTARGKLAGKAAELGANVVVMEGEVSEVAAAVPVGGLLVPVSEVRYSSVAMVC